MLAIADSIVKTPKWVCLAKCSGENPAVIGKQREVLPDLQVRDRKNQPKFRTRNFRKDFRMCSNSYGQDYNYRYLKINVLIQKMRGSYENLGFYGLF